MKSSTPIFKVSYDGSRFHGSQLQASIPTVQRTIEWALKGLTNSPKARIIFSGRTDTGVHSKGQVFSVVGGLKPDTKKTACLLNKKIGPFIRITGWADAPGDFGPRFHAISRTYEYLIRQNDMPNAFKDAYSTPVMEPIDLELARETANFFIGTRDYKNLTIKAHEQKRMERTVDDVTITEGDDNLLILTFKSKAFLRRQVRNMVNLIILGGQNQLTLEKLESLLNNEKKESMIRPAPAGGLYLTEIKYEEEYFPLHPLPLVSW